MKVIVKVKVPYIRKNLQSCVFYLTRRTAFQLLFKYHCAVRTTLFTLQIIKKGKGKVIRHRVGRCTALLFHDRGTRRGWVVSSTSWPHFTPGKDPVPIVQEAGWATGPVWTGGKSRPHLDQIPDRPARSQSLYWLSYPAHMLQNIYHHKWQGST